MTNSKSIHKQTHKTGAAGPSRIWIAALMVAFSALLVFPLPSHAKTDAPAAKWNVQVDKVDPGSSGLEPAFCAAIYESLLEELTKTKQFNQVLRSGDRNAAAVADLLILKIAVRKYTPGSETMRAVTTFKGTTQIHVRLELTTRDGRVVLENAIGGNVRFIGNNLRATHNLAHNVAKTLNHSSLAGPAASALAQKAGKDPILLP